MWDLLLEIFKAYGLFGLIIAGQTSLIAYLLRLLNRKDTEKQVLSDRLLSLSEKRLEDAKEERQDYEELARNLDKSIDLLIKVFRRRNGSDEE